MSFFIPNLAEGRKTERRLSTMEDNKNNQAGGTPTPTNDNGANGGKTFTQADMDALAGKIRNEEKAKHDQAVKDAVANALEEERRQAKLTAEEREKEAKTKREAENCVRILLSWDAGTSAYRTALRN